MSQFERIEEIERHKTIERPMSEIRDMPRPGYVISKPLPDFPTSTISTQYPELPIPQPKRKYTKKAKK